MAYNYIDDRLSPNRPNAQAPSQYNVSPSRPYMQQPQPQQYSQYSQPDPYYSHSSTSVNHTPSPTPYQAVARAPSPNYQPPETESLEMAPYNSDPYFHHQQPAMQSRPSFTSYRSDYPDESKSFTSTAPFAQKEWDAAPPLPPMPYQAYPPRPSPTFAPSYSSGTSHWHQMRNHLLERRVVQQIPLHNGNLILDVPVPNGVIPSTTGLGVQSDEMTSMRYSAATCDPDEFMSRKFSLRPYLYGRRTELFVSRKPILKPQLIKDVRRSS